MNWLDTQTKALLQRDYEPPDAPAKVPDFALVMGALGVNKERVVNAIRKINSCTRSAAIELIRQRRPVVINSDMTEEEAILGQFELICCDTISAVIRTEVADEGDRDYLKDLLETIARSPEFAATPVRIDAVPLSEEGKRLVDQFLAMDPERLQKRLPCTFTMPAKKARIMKHWAERVGAVIDIQAAEAKASP
jgi:hypothetical protein